MKVALFLRRELVGDAPRCGGEDKVGIELLTALVADEVLNELSLALGEQAGYYLSTQRNAAHGVGYDKWFTVLTVRQTFHVPGLFCLEQFMFTLALNFENTVARSFAEILHCGICCGKLAVSSGLAVLLARFAGRELKADIALARIEYEIGIEGTIGTLGHKAGDEFALALCQYFVELVNGITK